MSVERMKHWNEVLGHISAGDVWLFVLMMITLIALVIWIWRDE